MKLEAVRLVLVDGLSQTAAGKRLRVTQRAVSHWLDRYHAGKLGPRELVPVPAALEQAAKALESVQAAWREVFGPSDR